MRIARPRGIVHEHPVVLRGAASTRASAFRTLQGDGPRRRTGSRPAPATALQSWAPQCGSSGETTTRIRSMRATPAIASMEWNIIGLPATGCTAWGRGPRCACPVLQRARRRRLLAWRDFMVVPLRATWERADSPLDCDPFRDVNSGVARLPGCRRFEEAPGPSRRVAVRRAGRPHGQRARDLLRGRAGPALGTRIRPGHALREGARREARFIVPTTRHYRPDPSHAAGAPRRGRAAAALRFSRRPRVGTFVPDHPARGRRRATETKAEVARRAHGQAHRRDRRDRCRLPALPAGDGVVPIVRLGPETAPRTSWTRWPTAARCALVESNRFTLARRYFPPLEPAFNVGKPLEYAVAHASRRKETDPRRRRPFFERLRRTGP